MISKCFGFVIVLLLSLSLSAQNEEAPNAELSSQTEFIDALKEIHIGNTDKAIRLLETFKSKHPTNATAHYELARLYDHKGNAENAILSIDQAVTLDPQNKWFRVQKINLLEKYNRLASVAVEYEMLATQDIENYNYYENAALAYLKSEQTEKALSILQKAEKVFGLTPRIAEKQADVFVLLNKEKKAIAILEKSVAQFITNVDLLKKLLDLYTSTKDQKNSDQIIAKLKALDAYDDSQKTVVVESDLNNPDSQIKVLIPMLSEYMKNQDPKLLQQLKQSSNTLLKQFPENAKVHALAGDISFQSYQLYDAQAHYNHSLKYDVSNYAVWENVLYSLNQLNHWSNLSNIAQQAAELYPNSFYIAYCLGHGLYYQNKFIEAQQALTSAEMLTGSDKTKQLQTQILKAQILDKTKLSKEAQSMWESILIDHGSMEVVQLEYALFNASTDPKKTSDILSKIKSNTGNTYAMYLQAQCLSRVGKHKEALDIMQVDKPSIGQLGTDILNFIADLYQQLGNAPKAIEYLKKAQAIAENPDYFAKKIQDVQTN